MNIIYFNFFQVFFFNNLITKKIVFAYVDIECKNWCFYF